MSATNHPISHHTSHTMENGASSSNHGLHDNGEDSDTNSRKESGFLEASLRSLTINDFNIAIDGTPREPDEFSDDATTQAYSPCFSEDGFSRKSDYSDTGTSTEATSMCSSGNLFNFSIIDSTLREGEQFATAYFDTAQKLKIAQALDEFGVEYIEVTSPAASEQSRADCEAICKLGLKAKILCHIRCNMEDARVAVQTGVDGINMCIGTSPHLMKHSHGKNMAYITAKVREVIEYVKANKIEIRFSGEDSFRSDFAEILELYSLVDRLGANRVGIADTVGNATPLEVFDKIDTLRKVVGCDIETHFHNDTGCAVANAYVALEAGATHIDTTVLGIGERNGITPLSGLMACLIRTDRKNILSKYKTETLSYLEYLVAQIVEVDIPFNNFVVPLQEGD